MEFTLENLERAVSQFYHTDASLQAQAHQWLTSAQSSPNAWCFVWELLQPCKVGQALILFAWWFIQNYLPSLISYSVKFCQYPSFQFTSFNDAITGMGIVSSDLIIFGKTYFFHSKSEVNCSCGITLYTGSVATC